MGASTWPVEWLTEDCFELALRVDSFREQFEAALKSRSESEARRGSDRRERTEAERANPWEAGPRAPE